MLKRFYTAIVHRRRAVLAAFVLAAVLSVFASRAVQVDYDINDYLPPDSPSTIALEQMNSAFTGGIPNMRVMVRDVTVPEALDYKEKLAAIDGVEAVTRCPPLWRPIPPSPRWPRSRPLRWCMCCSS